jgi:hypothetical protein
MTKEELATPKQVVDVERCVYVNVKPIRTVSRKARTGRESSEGERGMRLTEKICSCWELLTTGTLLAWKLDKQQSEFWKKIAARLKDERDHYIERSPKLVYTSWHGDETPPRHKRTFDVWKVGRGHYRVSIKAPGDEYDEDASLVAAMRVEKYYSKTRNSRTAAIRLGRATVRVLEINEFCSRN